MVLSYPETVLATPGLKAYWPLDEVNGTVARELVSGIDATYVGAALGITGPLSNGGSGAQCDGINDCIEAPAHSAWQLAKPVYEWCMWVPSTQAGTNCFMACEDEVGVLNRGFCQFFGSHVATFHTKRGSDGANLTFGVNFSTEELYNKWVHILWKPGIRGVIINGKAYSFPGGDFGLASGSPTRLTLGAGRIGGILTRYSAFRFGQLAVYDGSLGVFGSKASLLALGQEHYQAMQTAFGGATIENASSITAQGIRMRTGAATIESASSITAGGRRVRYPARPVRLELVEPKNGLTLTNSKNGLTLTDSANRLVRP